ncbi:hypothetical protein ACIRPT_19790 [Streptomyces sp. NPDC101227]|uniref:hypothetical protein n=1 Tax=Streptomyces sp. NPDC101227 TaxID=3366136 RepID=UPI003807BDFE
MGTTTTEKRTDDEIASEADAAGKTATDNATEDARENATETVEETAADKSGEPGDAVAAEADAQSEDAARTAPGIAAGAGAVVAAGLGLASVTGTWLGTLMAERQTVVGQINLQAHRTTDQIAAVYGTPWHTTALVNGVFALLAVIVAAVVLTRPRATWVRAVAWGGLALGVLGLFIAAGMYLDLFASMPSIPTGAAPGA